MNITLNLHVLFVYFMQAFDSTKRIQIYEILQQTEIPSKLVRLIKEGTSLNIIYLKNSQSSKE
jgi:hypothetical protein